jgi:hypothetical protein
MIILLAKDVASFHSHIYLFGKDIVSSRLAASPFKTGTVRGKDESEMDLLSSHVQSSGDNKKINE